MEDINVSDPNLWKTLAAIFGPGGLVLLLTNAGTAYFVRMMWGRLKEKDEECQRELATAALASSDRANQMRLDVKEAFQNVADLTKQVTLLVDRANR